MKKRKIIWMIFKNFLKKYIYIFFKKKLIYFGRFFFKNHSLKKTNKSIFKNTIKTLAIDSTEEID